MLHKIKPIALIISMLIVSGCENKEVLIEKDYFTKNGKETIQSTAIEGEVYSLNQYDIIKIDNYVKDSKQFDAFYDLPFENTDAIKKYLFSLERSPKDIIDAQVEILSEIRKIKKEKENEFMQEMSIINTQKNRLVSEMALFMKRTRNYTKEIKLLEEDKKNILAEKEAIDSLVNGISIDLSKKINKLYADNENISIQELQFLKFSETNDICEQEFEVKKDFTRFYQKEGENCLALSLPIGIDDFGLLLQDKELFYELMLNIKIIKSKMIETGRLVVTGTKQSKNNLEIKELDEKIQEEYKRIEKKYGLTKYEIDGKIKSLNNEILEKEKEYQLEYLKKDEKVRRKILLHDYSNLKNIMREAEAKYLKDFEKEILGMPLEKRIQFPLIKLTPEEGKKEVYVIIDRFKNENITYKDVVVVDALKIKNDKEIIRKKSKPLDVELLSEKSSLMRFKGDMNMDMEKILLKAKEMLEAKP